MMGELGVNSIFPKAKPATGKFVEGESLEISKCEERSINSVVFVDLLYSVTVFSHIQKSFCQD